MEQTREVQLTEFTQALAQEAVEANETVVVKNADKEVARFIPNETATAKPKRTPGCLKGKLKVGAEFFEPLPEDMLT